MIFMATSSSSTLLESTASAENGGGSTTLPLGPQVAQQIPFQVRNLRAMVRYPGFYTHVCTPFRGLVCVLILFHIIAWHCRRIRSQTLN